MVCAASCAGLLANLTCIQAELYQMELALSVRENPLWVVPYSTIAQDYTDLLGDFDAYAQVHLHDLDPTLQACMDLSNVNTLYTTCANVHSIMSASCGIPASLQCLTDYTLLGFLVVRFGGLFAAVFVSH